MGTIKLPLPMIRVKTGDLNKILEVSYEIGVYICPRGFYCLRGSDNDELSQGLPHSIVLSRIQP
jgi:hypothetical protein